MFSNNDDFKTSDSEKDKLIGELKQELVLKRARISSLEQKVRELTKENEIGRCNSLSPQLSLDLL